MLNATFLPLNHTPDIKICFFFKQEGDLFILYTWKKIFPLYLMEK